MNVYVIEGESGEYADTTRWFLGCSMNKVAAEKLVSYLNAQLEEVGLDVPFKGRTVRAQKKRNAAINTFRSRHDDKFECNYAGAGYTLHTVPFMEA